MAHLLVPHGRSVVDHRHALQRPYLHHQRDHPPNLHLEVRREARVKDVEVRHLPQQLIHLGVEGSLVKAGSWRGEEQGLESRCQVVRAVPHERLWR